MPALLPGSHLVKFVRVCFGCGGHVHVDGGAPGSVERDIGLCEGSAARSEGADSECDDASEVDGCRCRPGAAETAAF